MIAAQSSRTPSSMRHVGARDLEFLSLQWQAQNDPEYSKFGHSALKKLRADEFRKSRVGTIRQDGGVHYALLNQREDNLPAPDDFDYRPEQPDPLDKYSNQLSALLPAIVAHFRTSKSKKAVGLVIKGVPFATIARIVGLSRRQIYYIRDKLRAILPELIAKTVLPLFSQANVDLRLARGPAKTAKAKRNRKFLLINNQPTLL